MAFNWEAAENALHAWIVAESGLAAEVVLWERQSLNSGRLSARHIGLQLGDATALSGHSDASQAYDSGAANGEEITRTLTLVKQVSFEVIVYAGASLGASSARAMAETLRNSLLKKSVRAALQAVGFSCVDLGRVSSLPEIVAADFEARSILAVSLLFTDEIEEKSGYIATVEVTETLSDSTFTITTE